MLFSNSGGWPTFQIQLVVFWTHFDAVLDQLLVTKKGRIHVRHELDKVLAQIIRTENLLQNILCLFLTR